MALRIKTTTVDGKRCFNSETIELLVGFSQHKQCCNLCEHFSNGQGDDYCAFGAKLMRQIRARPDVEYVEVGEDVNDGVGHSTPGTWTATASRPGE